METPSEPKPKRKYVMTPEHRAKVIANLAKARLAPKEEVYRRTEKRYAANLRNLAIAQAKRREDAQREEAALRAKMESAFPLDPVLRPPGSQQGTGSDAGENPRHDSRNSPENSDPQKRGAAPSEPRVSTSGQPRETVPAAAPATATTPVRSTPPSGGVDRGKGGTDADDPGANDERSGRDARIPKPPGADELDEVTRLVGKRLREVRYARRREGRRIMRLLTEALNMPHPLYPFMVADLAADLLHCLDPDRITEEVRRLNNRIAGLLLKMIEARYGPEPLSEWEERGLRLLQQLRELAEEEGSRQKTAGTPGSGVRDSEFSEEPSVVRSPSSVAEEPVDAPRVTTQGEVSSTTDHGPQATDDSSASPESRVPLPGSSANSEPRTPNPEPRFPCRCQNEACWASYSAPSRRRAGPLARALDLEPDDAECLSASIWERLHACDRAARRKPPRWTHCSVTRPPPWRPPIIESATCTAAVSPATCRESWSSKSNSGSTWTRSPRVYMLV